MAVKSFELVDYEVRDRVAWLEINNAERMNALSTGVQNGLWLAFDEAINDEDVLVVVLTGRGGRAFCAGADLKETAERDRTVGQGSPQQARSGLSKATDCLKPVIAAIDGYALGGRDAAIGALRHQACHGEVPLRDAGAAPKPHANQLHGHPGDGFRPPGRGHVDYTIR